MKLKKFNKNFITSTACAILFLVPSASVSSDPLKEIFGLMTTSAGGSSFESQKRNGIAFGTFSGRFQMYQPKVVSFQPPSLNAGCGGIDFFGGSIGLLKKEELVQMGRNIAAGAAVYAFNLAVESLCPSCAQTMSWLQDKLDQFNDFVSGTCQQVVDGLSANKVGGDLANQIKDTVNIGGWHEKLDSLAETHTDPQRSWVELLSERSEDGAVGPSTPMEGMYGNMMWNGLGDSDIDDWNFASGFGKNEMQELLMSLTGTLVFKQKDADNVEWVPYPNLITVSDLVESDESTPIKIYKCNTSEDKDPKGRLPCTKFINDEGSKVKWVGIYNKSLELLTGKGTELGIRRKIIQKIKLNPDEQAFVNNTPVPVMTMLFKLGKSGQAQIAMSHIAAMQVSFLYVDQLIDQLYKILKVTELALESKVENVSQKNIDFIKTKIIEIEKQREALRIKYKDQLELGDSIYQTYEKLLDSVQGLSGSGA